MKNPFLILLFCCHFCFGGDEFTISGTVDPIVRKYVILHLQYPLSSLKTLDTVSLDRTGRFEHKISAQAFFTILLEVDSVRSPLFVSAYNGESLHLTIRNPGTQVGISGSMSRVQQFTMVDREHFGELHKRYTKRNPQFSNREYLRTDGYFKVLDSLTLERIRYLKEWFTDPVTPTERAFIKSYEIGYIYDNLFYKQSYPNPPLEKFKFYQDKYQLHPVASYRFSDLVKFNDAGLCYIGEYRRFVNSFLIEELRIRRERNQTPFSWPEVVRSGMGLIDEWSCDIKAREFLKAVFLADITDEIQRDKKVSAAIDVLSCLESTRLTSKPFAELRSRLTSVISDNRFQKGNPAPDFEFLDTQGKIVTLANFQGKKIVMDIGASWCGPCIAEIPDWNERVTANTDPEVVHIFLSLDNTQEEWKRFIKKYPVKGLLLFAGNGGFKSRFARDYQIESLPHEMVIDRGRIEVYKKE